jgi:DNA-binding NarL/FixJ family response regulator
VEVRSPALPARGSARCRRSAAGPVRLVVVDDHPPIGRAIAAACAEATDIDLVGSARTLDEARRLIETSEPDVVLCDLQLGGEAEGLTLLATIAGAGRPAIVILTAFDYPALLRAAFERGAAGYLLKTAEMGEVLDAVRTAATGGSVFSAQALRTVRLAPRSPSERELDVLGLLTEGASNEEIATRLFISLKTVESHLRRMFARYGVLSRTELAVLALREGWLAGPRRQ